MTKANEGLLPSWRFCADWLNLMTEANEELLPSWRFCAEWLNLMTEANEELLPSWRFGNSKCVALNAMRLPIRGSMPRDLCRVITMLDLQKNKVENREAS